MPDWLFQLAGYLIAGGMSYGAIRTDLKALHERLGINEKTAERAHVRIDDHIDRHHTRKGD